MCEDQYLRDLLRKCRLVGVFKAVHVATKSDGVLLVPGLAAALHKPMVDRLIPDRRLQNHGEGLLGWLHLPRGMQLT